MNLQHDLQHLDIKPQNLFLFGTHIKVADFGLVKDLEGFSARVTVASRRSMLRRKRLMAGRAEILINTVSRLCCAKC